MLFATLIAARRLTPSVRELTFLADAPIAFVPGQWVSVRANNELLPTARRSPHDAFVSRSYSLASAPRAAPSFDIAVTRVGDGAMSPFMHELPLGARLEITEPRGFFTLAELRRPLIFIATGTGVAPFRAMLQSLASAADTSRVPRVTLILGVRHEEDLLYADEFRALASAHGWFRFEPTLSQPSDAWRGRRGYVQAHLREVLDELAPANEAHTRDAGVYVCGLGRMVKEARKTARDELGVPKPNVHVERYD